MEDFILDRSICANDKEIQKILKKALLRAIKKESHHMVKYLLKIGADPNSVTILNGLNDSRQKCKNGIANNIDLFIIETFKVNRIRLRSKTIMDFIKPFVGHQYIDTCALKFHKVQKKWQYMFDRLNVKYGDSDPFEYMIKLDKICQSYFIVPNKICTYNLGTFGSFKAKIRFDFKKALWEGMRMKFLDICLALNHISTNELMEILTQYDSRIWQIEPYLIWNFICLIKHFNGRTY
jgi:hypothetical protein